MHKRSTLLVIFLISLSASAVYAQVDVGDQHYAVRAEGAQGARAKAQHIDAAIAAYHRAVTQDTNNLEARWKLLRSYRFKAFYVASSNAEKKQVLDKARKIGEGSLQIINSMLAARGIKSVVKATEKQIAEAIRPIAGAGEVFYWDAVIWGEWALVYGKMAAVREGVGDRLKRESTIVLLSDSKIELGGGARVLGRLHHQTPRVPFLTGWASNELAVKYLKQSLAMDTSNKITKVFLAEAMVSHNKSTKPQAVEILRQVINSPNDPNYAVEHAGAQVDARAILKSWGVK